jgi:hypothetical protein
MIWSSDVPPSEFGYWLNILVNRIVECFHPLKIIVLCYYLGAGIPYTDSDINLVVVFEELSNQREMNIAIRKAARGNPLNFDVFSIGLTDFEYYSTIPGEVYYFAATEGKVIYEHNS